MTSDFANALNPLIPADRWAEYMEWATDGGYDESFHDRWHSKSRDLQRQFLEETDDRSAALP